MVLLLPLQPQEETMAEDPVNSPTPGAPVFGQQPISPSPGGFMFASQPTNSFPFGGQQNQAAPQNPNPFQASGSQEFGAGGSFSMGSGAMGGDKSGRKYVKPNRIRRKK